MPLEQHFSAYRKHDEYDPIPSNCRLEHELEDDFIPDAVSALAQFRRARRILFEHGLG
jgi:hypothetical protein